MKIRDINMVYLIGVGGIGMSALARYFNQPGKKVAGYDLTRTGLTDKLTEEGIAISYRDDAETIPACFTREGSRHDLMVIYTPAIPERNNIFGFFKTGNYNMVKRSVVLGALVNEAKGIAVAGTHGKTSVSSLIAHLMSQSGHGCNAFLGGVLKNFNTNLLVDGNSEFFVVEADEYDRSFLQLYPFIAVITSMDPDHLDVYGTFDEMVKAFSVFTRQVKAGGTIICKYGLKTERKSDKGARFLSYGLDNRADYYAFNIRISAGGTPVFDLLTPSGSYKDLRLGIPGRFNVENAVAATAAALTSGLTVEEVRSGLESFGGVYRRFDFIINKPGKVLIDDYAHHPEELKACIAAVKEIFPGREITGVFQPHLYSRTRDFAGDFAESLEELDNLVLLDIYPAREEPVAGVSSELIYRKVKLKNKILCSREQLTSVIDRMQTDIVIILGAGNIDTMVEPVKKVLLNK